MTVDIYDNKELQDRADKLHQKFDEAFNDMELFLIDAFELATKMERDRIRAELERVAKSHDELAIAHPMGPDKVKAMALRRFIEGFLP